MVVPEVCELSPHAHSEDTTPHEDPLMVFEWLPDGPRLHASLQRQYVTEHVYRLMRESYDPAISAALEHAHPMQTIHGLKPHPEGYLLVADCGEALKDDLPEAFDREILPRLRETVEKDNCLQNWVVDYHGRGMMFVEDPDQCDMFLYSCLQDIRKISYCTPVTARAIDLLERFGGKREIRALGMLAAYAGASGGRYAGSVDVVADPTPAWRRIWGMYFPDLSESSG